MIVAEVHPLKQGLKHRIVPGHDLPGQVAEVHPLKQGLKLRKKDGRKKRKVVAEVHPLKQGLKPSRVWGSDIIILELQRYIH